VTDILLLLSGIGVKTGSSFKSVENNQKYHADCDAMWKIASFVAQCQIPNFTASLPGKCTKMPHCQTIIFTAKHLLKNAKFKLFGSEKCQLATLPSGTWLLDFYEVVMRPTPFKSSRKSPNFRSSYFVLFVARK